ncbi:MAG: C10 family peptidase [Kiritimatiellae bacterium]|nr:C10 family peptidase [Kiritimatiellia bacterium]
MKRIILALLLAFLAASLQARVLTDAEIESKAERLAASRDVAMPLGGARSVASVEKISLPGGDLWAVRLSPSGHMILTPFSGDGIVRLSPHDFVWPEENPHGAAFLDVIAGEAAKNDAESASKPGRMTIQSLPEKYPYIAPIELTKWNQTGVHNWFAPGDAPCGCTALAYAQFMRVMEWPARIEETATWSMAYTHDSVKSEAEPYLAYPYVGFDYSKMGEGARLNIDPYDELYETSRLVLYSDILAKMQFAKGGSAAWIGEVAGGQWYETPVLVYNNGTNDTVNAKYLTALHDAVSEGIPVCVSMMTSSQGAHAVMLSGWTYFSDEEYMWMNFGWGGSSDGWYPLKYKGSEKANGIDIIFVSRPVKTVQTDPIPVATSLRPSLAWHLPACYTNKVSGFTVKAFKGGQKTEWSDDFTTQRGIASGDPNRWELSGGKLLLKQLPNGNPFSPIKSFSYTWKEAFVATANSVLSFEMSYADQKWPFHLDIRKMGGEWTTLRSVTNSVPSATVANWAIPLSDYAGFACQLRVRTTDIEMANSVSGVKYTISPVTVSNVSAAIDVSSVQTWTVNDSKVRTWTAPSDLADGSLYSFTVTPVFADTSVRGLESQPVMTRVSSAASAAERTIGFSSPGAEVLPGMKMANGVYRRCTYDGKSIVRVKAPVTTAKLTVLPHRPVAFPVSAVEQYDLGGGVYDLVFDGTKVVKDTPSTEMRGLYTVLCEDADGSVVAKEMILHYLSNAAYAVAETYSIPEGGDPDPGVGETDEFGLVPAYWHKFDSGTGNIDEVGCFEAVFEGQDFCVMASLKSVETSDAILFSTGSYDSNGAALLANGQNSVKFYLHRNNQYDTSCTVDVSDATTKFHHYAINYSGGKYYLYVDGKIAVLSTDASKEVMYTRAAPDRGIGLGAMNKGTGSLSLPGANGLQVDDFRVYGGAFTASEIAKYAALFPVSEGSAEPDPIDPGTVPAEPDMDYTGTFFVPGVGKGTTVYDVNKSSGDKYFSWGYCVSDMLAWYHDEYKSAGGELGNSDSSKAGTIAYRLKSAYGNNDGDFAEGVKKYIAQGYMQTFIDSDAWTRGDASAYATWPSIDGFSRLILENLYKGPALAAMTPDGVTTNNHAVVIWGAEMNGGEVEAVYVSNPDDKGTDPRITRHAVSCSGTAVKLGGFDAYKVDSLTFLWAPSGIVCPAPVNPSVKTEVTFKLPDGTTATRMIDHKTGWMKRYLEKHQASELNDDTRDSNNNGVSDKDEYLLGTDPDDENSKRLRITGITFDGNGHPRIAHEPEGDSAVADIIVQGSAFPGGPWKNHEDSDADHRFFRVTVTPK